MKKYFSGDLLSADFWLKPCEKVTLTIEAPGRICQNILKSDKWVLAEVIVKE